MEEADPDLVETVQAARFDYFLGLVERAADVAETADEPRWLDVVRADQANIDAAMLWALDCGDGDRALRMSAGLFTFWIYTSVAAHVVALVDRALALPVVSRTPAVLRTRARALNAGGYAAIGVPDLPLAQARFAEELALWESLGDDVGIATSLRGSGHAYLHAGNWEAARAQIERSLAVSEAAHDRPGIDLVDPRPGRVARRQRKSRAGRGRWLDALVRFEGHGMGFGVYRIHLSLGILGLRRDDRAAALRASAPRRKCALPSTSSTTVRSCSEQQPVSPPPCGGDGWRPSCTGQHPPGRTHTASPPMTPRTDLRPRDRSRPTTAHEGRVGYRLSDRASDGRPSTRCEQPTMRWRRWPRR